MARSHTLEAYKGSSVMESLRDEDMGIEAICGGQCACATCHCLLDEAWFEKLTPPGEDESELLESLDHYDSRSLQTDLPDNSQLAARSPRTDYRPRRITSEKIAAAVSHQY